MLKKSNNILLIILLLGLILRLLGLINISLSGDFKIHWQTAGTIIKLREFPLLGPNASINPNLYLGPFYYYLLAIPYLMGGGDYKIAIIFFSLLNTLSILLLYIICQSWFKKTTALKITALFSVSYFMIISQNYPWNPHFLFLLNFFAIFCLQKINKGKTIFVALLFLSLGLLLQSHATSIFLFPFYFLNLPFKKIKTAYFLLGIFLFISSIFPWLLANYLCGNCQILELKKILINSKPEQCNLFEWINYHGHGERCFYYFRNSIFVLKLFSESLIGSTGIFGVFISGLLIMWYVIKGKNINKKFFVTWLIIPMFLFLFYSSNVYLHYFLIFIPLPFIIFTLFLEELKKHNKCGKQIGTFLYCLIVILNITLYLISLSKIRL